MEKNKTRGFESIQTAQELIAYLDSLDRLKNRKYLYHYTTLASVVGIYRNGKWYLGRAKNMNDRFEYEKGDSYQWDKIYFSSFMAESKESLGMWSMYSQPWEQGVQIAIPISDARRWIKETNDLFEVPQGMQGGGFYPSIDDTAWTINFSSVAYSDEFSRGDEPGPVRLTWSNQENTQFQHLAKDPKLTGYVKDNAWDYEKEVRLKVTFKKKQDFQKIAVPVPDYILDSLIIFASPLFKGNLEQELKKAIDREYKTDQSLFTDRLQNIKEKCDNCMHHFVAVPDGRGSLF